MGRYGRYNNNYRVTKDFDSSNVQPDEDQDERPNPIARIGSSLKERYQKYNSPDARMERRQKELTKRKQKIEDLSYNAKKEGLKATIRKSKQVAPTDYGFGIGGVTKKSSGKRQSSRYEGTVHFPQNNYGSMDRMFGIGGPVGKTQLPKNKPTKNEWGSFDRMFGI